MTAKYDPDRELSGRQWQSDREHVLATWSDNPFVGHRHRHERVEHRVVIQYTDGVGADIRHEVRSEDLDRLPDEEWALVESVELRSDYARHDRHDRARWFR